MITTMPKNQISYSTVGFRDRNIQKALEAVAEAGFSQVEILGQEPHVADPLCEKQLSALKSCLKNCGLSARTVHAPLKKNVLGAPEEEWRRGVVNVLGNYLRFAATLHANDVIIHPVPNPIFVPNSNHPSIINRISEAVPRSLDQLIPVADREGVRILLENLPYPCNYPYLGMNELKCLVDDYPYKQLGLVIDTGHAWTSKKDPSSEIVLAGNRLKGTHLQDVDFNFPDDNHWLPTEGGLDWTAIRKSLNSVNYSGPLTFEVYQARRGETPEQLASLAYKLGKSWSEGVANKESI